MVENTVINRDINRKNKRKHKVNAYYRLGKKINRKLLNDDALPA
jgi:hypothetical protein